MIFLKYLFYECIHVLPASISVHYLCAWCRRKSEVVLDALEMELQMISGLLVDVVL